MPAFLAIARWEVRYYTRRISTWVYFGIFFAIAMLFMLALGGAWPEATVALGTGGKVKANAPSALASIIPLMSLLGVSITAALVGNSLYRDYEVAMDPLLYTTPVSRGAFLGGRFVGSLLVNAIVLLGIGAGAFAASISPWVQADKFAPFDLWAYASPYLTHVYPNLLFTAAIFFALVSFTRQMLPNYVGGALLLIGWLMSSAGLQKMSNRTAAALVDPFGMRARALMAEYWSIAEQNVRYTDLSGVLLANRLLWAGVALAIFGVAYFRFRFEHAAKGRAKRQLPQPVPGASPATVERWEAPIQLDVIPEAQRGSGSAATMAQFTSILSRSFRRIVRSSYFAAILAGGLLYLMFAARAAGELYGTKTWPVTYEMVEVLQGTFGIFIVVVIAFYAGELVWAERDARIDGMVDATPVSTSVVLAAKFTALCGIVVALLLVMMVAGIAMQAIKGYTRFEIGLYLQSLLGVQLIDYVLIAVLAFAVHVVVNHKYLGHLVVVVAFIGTNLMGQLGFEHNLYQFGSDGGISYSDMNRWGPYLTPFIWWKAYWTAFAVALLCVVAAFWVRGEEDGFEARWHIARSRLRGRLRTALGVSLVAFVGIGGFLFYNTNVLNAFRTRSEDRRLRKEYEEAYKRWASKPQPRIVAVRVGVDLYPSQQNVVARGEYLLRNASTVPIDTVFLTLSEEMQLDSLVFDRSSTVVKHDPAHDVHLYGLGTPLAPGDSMRMTFAMAHRTRGFPNQIQNQEVVANGTFLENVMFMPGLGYDAGRELTDDDARKRAHLPERPRMRAPTAPGVRNENYVSHDADFVRYDATVSTDVDQIAITSGTLQREWTEQGRRYFHYTMDAPIINLWAFQSARYTQKRDKWNDVDVIVDYHPTHAYNVDRMIEGVKKSLDYYTREFGPYQHHQVRIVEFPRYAAFAQSLPNTIPYSEAIGFIARVEKPEDIDYPFYVTAHEVAHQWWAHQLIGADAAGSTLLSETLAQYSALMVMEKQYGADNMRRFLEYELHNYLTGRSTERKSERPLSLVENQPYIHYNKGSLAMYALRDYIGESALNGVIRSFLEPRRFRGPPYATSLDFVEAIRAATPDSLRYVVADLFDTITLYEMKTDSVIVSDAPNDRYMVDLYVTAKKLRADSLGVETEEPMADLVDLGVYARRTSAQPGGDTDGRVIYLSKHRVRTGAQHFSIVTDEMPWKAGIDPLRKLVDRVTKDNTLSVINRAKRKPTEPKTPAATPKPDSAGRGRRPN